MIPYEKQSDGPSNRMCGAAALSMVYRSLTGSRAAHGTAEKGDRRRAGDRRIQPSSPPDGREMRQGPRRITEVTQTEIWKHVSKPNRFGNVSCSTHLMVKDALRRGFAAVALQASDPLQMLLACRANGIRAILNHRLKPDSPAGHFTVLLGLDGDGAIVHDPSSGPSQRIPFGELLELWQPRFANSEIVGNLLIGIADHPPRLERCIACRTPIPVETPCPKCTGPVPLAPSALVGCVGSGCIKRSWIRVCCPSCDFTFPFLGGTEKAAPAARRNPLNLDQLFAHLERFQAHVLSIPEVAGREDVKQQLALLGQTKEELRLAVHEDFARQESEDLLCKERLDAAEKEREKVRKAQEDAAQAASPLDGNALGAQLLKNLGIVK